MAQDRVLERKIFQPGDKIFKEGEEGNLAYLIQEGEVQIVKNGTVLATVGKGGIIGEMALLDSNIRMATARAVKGGTAIVITRQMFELKMNKTDPFIRGLLNILADHVRRMGAEKSDPPPAPAAESPE
ncbi:MAG: cyclic nucleotide-binding domain-containing protein [Rhodospirillaceae bacterium]|nr:cyclic nucleotide-binding domain-containing protein [Rhodospirillaceae bacterium]